MGIHVEVDNAVFVIEGRDSIAGKDVESLHQVESQATVVGTGIGLQSTLASAMVLADVFGSKRESPKIRTFSWDERDTSLDHLPKPQAVKDRQKKNRQAKRKRKAKRGH